MYPSISQLPLVDFERYLLFGVDKGYPEQYWADIAERYDQLTGDHNAEDTRRNIGRHTNLIGKHELASGLLSVMVSLAEAGAYSHKIAARLREIFPSLKFPNKDGQFQADIAKACSKLKATVLQIKEVQDILPTEAQAMSETHFDEIILAYNITFGYSEVKKDMSVQYFALMYKRLKERIEHDKKNSSNGI